MRLERLAPRPPRTDPAAPRLPRAALLLPPLRATSRAARSSAERRGRVGLVLPPAPVSLPPPGRSPRRGAAPEFRTRGERCGRCFLIIILKHKVWANLQTPGGARDPASPRSPHRLPPQQRPPRRCRQQPKLFRGAFGRRGAERLRALPGDTGRLARSRSGYPRTTSLTIPTPYPLRGGCAGPAHPPLPTPCSAGHFSEPQGPGRARRRRVRGGARRGAERGGGARREPAPCAAIAWAAVSQAGSGRGLAPGWLRRCFARTYKGRAGGR